MAELIPSLNRFTGKYLRKVKPLPRNAPREAVRRRVRWVKYYLGFGKTPEANTGDATAKFRRALASPKSPRLGPRVLAAGAARRRRQRRAHVKAGKASSAWGYSRTVTNEVVAIVGGRAPITSRKRVKTYGNPGSDHHVSLVRADAVDFGVANAYGHAREIARRLGGRWSGDYDSFTVTRAGRRFRVQLIAGTHGTGPHLHVGVRRV